MLAWAALSIWLEVNTSTTPECSQLDDWFLSVERSSQLDSTPFFPEVHEEVM